MARDLEADLKLCDAATPGPWHRIEHRIGRDAYLADAEIVGHRIYMNGEPVASTPVCQLHSGFIYFEGDIAFIEAAREGWPETIRELMEARKRVAELDGCNDSLLAEIAELEEVMDNTRLEAKKKLDEAQKRIAELETVVERYRVAMNRARKTVEELEDVLDG